MLLAPLLWIGSWWRELGAPLAWLALLAVLAANAASPGVCRRFWARHRRNVAWIVLAAGAVFVGLLAADVALGALAPGHAARSLVFFLAQLALYEKLPSALLALAGIVAVLWLDWHGESVPRWVEQTVWARLVAIGPALMTVAVALLTMLGAASFAASQWPDAMRGWGRADPAEAQRFSYYASFVNRALPADKQIELLTGFEPGPNGLSLAPGQSGTIVFRLERNPDTVVLLRPNFYNRALTPDARMLTERRFGNALEVSAGEGQPYRTLLADGSAGEILGNELWDLTPALAEARVYRLRFRAQNTTAGPVTVLPVLNVSTVVDPKTVPHPSFPVVAYGAAIALAGFVVLRGRGLKRRAAALAALGMALPMPLLARLVAAMLAGGGADGRSRLAAGASGVLEGLRFDPLGSAPDQLGVQVARVAFGVVICLGALAWWRRQSAAGWLLVACLAVSALALDVRWQALMPLRFDYLVPDARGYQSIAESFPRKMALFRPVDPEADPGPLWRADVGYDGKANALAVFYVGGNNGREPGWPGALRVTFNVLGASGFHTRLASIVAAVAATGLTCWFGWRLLHPLTGIGGGLLLAFDAGQARNSVLGLRDELVTALLIGLVAAAFLGTRHGERASWLRLLLAGGTAGALVLVRGDMLLLALELLVSATAMRVWGHGWVTRARREWRRIALPFVVLALVAGPMYAGFGVTQRDLFYPGTRGATVNRNLEFPERMGTPGFPTRSEYESDWTSGPPISATTYFFGYHSPLQFLTYAITGLGRIFTVFLYPGQVWRTALFVAGIALLLYRRRFLVPAVVLVALAPFYSFLAGAPGPMFVPRYAHHVLPYTELAAAYAVSALPIVAWASRQRIARTMGVAPTREAI